MSESRVYEEVVFAGFGGQGVVLAGKLLATAGMRAGYEVTFMPSYGAEVRGGTANSMVVLSREAIASPLASVPDVVVAMNGASLRKFGARVKAGGLVVVNSTLVTERLEREDVEVVEVGMDELAMELGAAKAANMVGLGAYVALRGMLEVGQVGDCLAEVLAERLHKTIPVNRRALEAGAECVGKNLNPKP